MDRIRDSVRHNPHRLVEVVRMAEETAHSRVAVVHTSGVLLADRQLEQTSDSDRNFAASTELAVVREH